MKAASKKQIAVRNRMKKAAKGWKTYKKNHPGTKYTDYIKNKLKK